MDEYIKKSDALKASKLVYIECLYLDEEEYEEAEADDIRVVFARDIESIPTADVEEVRHGEWIPIKQEKHWADTETISSDIVGFCCSECGAEEKFKYRYCHCGAKMDGKEQTDGET